MVDLSGRVALVTGAARGQGRSHAERLAAAGAKILAVDICTQIDSVPYPLATPDDLDVTVSRIRDAGGAAIGRVVDVRDLRQLEDAVEEATRDLGIPSIIVANAGIAPLTLEADDAQWHDVIDVNLTGVYHTVRAAVPGLKEIGGSVIITSSMSGVSGFVGQTPGGLGYTASKHGVLGLMRAYAIELGRYRVRVNAVLPGGVDTPMVGHEVAGAFLERAWNIRPASGPVLPVDGKLDPAEISDAVLWLASDESRMVTGVALPVDGGALVQ